MYLIFSHNRHDCVRYGLPGGPVSIRSKDSRPVQCQNRHGSQWRRPSVVCSATAFLQLYCCSRRAAGVKSKVHLAELALSRFLQHLWPIKLTPNLVMQRKGVPIFFDSASSTNLPSLYICRTENVLGRVPLMPCYISGNTHPTLPHRFGDRAGATADSSVGRGNGSRLYELNLWMWRYGRGQPRKITVEEAEQRRRERLTDARKRAVQTLKRRREERGTVQAAVDKDAVGDE